MGSHPEIIEIYVKNIVSHRKYKDRLSLNHLIVNQ